MLVQTYIFLLQTNSTCRFYKGNDSFTWNLREAKPFSSLQEAGDTANYINSMVGAGSPIGMKILPLVVNGQHDSPESALAALTGCRGGERC